MKRRCSVVCGVAGAEHEVLSSSCCKSLILTVQFVLQMAAKGINCTQRNPPPSFHSLLIAVTITDAGCDISLHFSIFFWMSDYFFSRLH